MIAHSRAGASHPTPRPFQSYEPPDPAPVSPHAKPATPATGLQPPFVRMIRNQFRVFSSRASSS